MSMFNQEGFSDNNEESINHNEADVTTQVAEAEIIMVMQEVSVMGGNDSEMGTLQNLLSDLRLQQISPKDAISKAISIRELKQDYH